MKKICIITSSFPKNKSDSKNAGVFVKDFATLLSKENFDVSVLTPKQNGGINDFESINVHFFPWLQGKYELSSLNPKNPIHLIKLVSMILSGMYATINFTKANKIDYCIAMWAMPSGFFVMLINYFLKIPYSVWALGSDIWNIDDYPFGKRILKKVLRNANNVFADGFELANNVKNISNKECKFLASGRILDKKIIDIDYTKFNPLKINFMYLGRYHKNKGIDLLIDAISLLSSDEKQKSLFHIFGGGPLEKEIKTKIKNLGLVDLVFLNSYLEGKNVYSFMSKADLIIIPSRIESIPVILSDSMQSKKPVLVTDVGDMGDLVKKFRVGFVTAANPQEIASEIKKIILLGKENFSCYTEKSDSLLKLLDLNQSVKYFQKLLTV